MAYPTFSEYLHAKIGKNWVIARRTRRIVERYGDDVVALSNAAYDKLRDAWIDGHPAIGLALTLPDCDSRALILRAVRRELS